jgi:hypothetical protein
MHRRTGLRTRLLVAIGPLAALHLIVFVVLLVTLHAHETADHEARGAARAAIVTGDVRTALDELESAERGVAIDGGAAVPYAAWRRSAARTRVALHALDRAGRDEEIPAARTLA